MLVKDLREIVQDEVAKQGRFQSATKADWDLFYAIAARVAAACEAERANMGSHSEAVAAALYPSPYRR